MYTHKQFAKLKEFEIKVYDVKKDIYENNAVYIGCVQKGSHRFGATALFTKSMCGNGRVMYTNLSKDSICPNFISCGVYTHFNFSSLDYYYNEGTLIKLDTIEELKHFL